MIARELAKMNVRHHLQRVQTNQNRLLTQQWHNVARDERRVSPPKVPAGMTSRNHVPLIVDLLQSPQVIPFLGRRQSTRRSKTRDRGRDREIPSRHSVCKSQWQWNSYIQWRVEGIDIGVTPSLSLIHI